VVHLIICVSPILFVPTALQPPRSQGSSLPAGPSMIAVKEKT
jgi:hypothetical protein